MELSARSTVCGTLLGIHVCCNAQWKSQGISCGLESGHTVMKGSTLLVRYAT